MADGTRPNHPARLSTRASLAGLALLLVACGSGGGTGSRSVEAGQTVVSLEFDDATASQAVARTLLARHGMKATFFVNSGVVGTDGYLDWGQVKALQDQGHEVAGHTVTHPRLADLPRDEAKREICTGRATLLARGFQVTNLAYPYGSYNQAVEELAAACGYNSGRTIDGADTGPCPTCPAVGPLRPADPFAIGGATVPTSTVDLAQLQRAVTTAEAQGGGWVHLVFHRLCEGCDRFSTPPATLAAFLDWLAPRSSSGTVVRTVREVVGGPVRPAVEAPAASLATLPNASLEADVDGNGVPDCWTETGYGEVTSTWARTADSHSGTSAVRLDITALARGDRKLLLAQDLGACSLTSGAGTSYRVGAWYRSTAPPKLVAFSRDADGRWAYWAESPPLAPASRWTPATWTTPPAPSGTVGISVGVLLDATGSLTVDDLSVVANPA